MRIVVLVARGVSSYTSLYEQFRSEEHDRQIASNDQLVSVERNHNNGNTMIP
jgi:hypothetical protein